MNKKLAQEIIDAMNGRDARDAVRNVTAICEREGASYSSSAKAPAQAACEPHPRGSAASHSRRSVGQRLRDVVSGGE